MYKLLALLTLTISGCASITPQGDFQQPFDRATPTASTDTFEELINLPRPVGAIPAAIYQFRDQTGQYKPDPSNNLSTAVTQGAESILVKALLDSGWFVPLERSGLQNILTERKIIQTANLEQSGKQSVLPAMSAARVVFEGSIVSYDSNTRTGGSGLRFLGVGGSHTYREDRVTVNLRVINTENGTILHSVNSTKTIFSRQLSSGIFSFVDEDKILEAEAGYSYNEPSHVAVVEAIESALINIIADGIIRNTWSLADIQGISSEAFDRYINDSDREKFLSQKTAQAQAAAERRRVALAVQERLKRGFSATNKYYEDTAEERRRIRQKAAAQVVRKQKAKSRITNKQAKTLTSAPKQLQVRQPTNADNQAVSTTGNQTHQQTKQLPIPAELIEKQAQQLLRLQADLQIRAAKQAYNNAMYARELLRQQENARHNRTVEPLAEPIAEPIAKPTTANEPKVIQPVTISEPAAVDNSSSTDTVATEPKATNARTSDAIKHKAQSAPAQTAGTESEQADSQSTPGKPYPVSPPWLDVSMR